MNYLSHVLTLALSLQAEKFSIDVRSYNTFTKSREELTLIALFHGGDYSMRAPKMSNLGMITHSYISLDSRSVAYRPR